MVLLLGIEVRAHPRGDTTARLTISPPTVTYRQTFTLVDLTQGVEGDGPGAAVGMERSLSEMAAATAAYLASNTALRDATGATCALRPGPYEIAAAATVDVVLTGQCSLAEPVWVFSYTAFFARAPAHRNVLAVVTDRDRKEHILTSAAHELTLVVDTEVLASRTFVVTFWRSLLAVFLPPTAVAGVLLACLGATRPRGTALTTAAFVAAYAAGSAAFSSALASPPAPGLQAALVLVLLYLAGENVATGAPSGRYAMAAVAGVAAGMDAARRVIPLDSTASTGSGVVLSPVMGIASGGAVGAVVAAAAMAALATKVARSAQPERWRRAFSVAAGLAAIAAAVAVWAGLV